VHEARAVIRRTHLGRLLLALALLAGTGCTTLSQRERTQVETLVTDTRAQALSCAQADACATPSALYDLGPRMRAASTETTPQHAVLLLDRGSDALLARLNLIHAAHRSIDLQTYIFDRDDSAQLVLEALLDAARRGVKVRLLVDQISAFKDPDVLAALATAHRNFEVRVYNPVFDRSTTGPVQYVLASLVQFRRLNQRMHTKLLLVDDAIGVVGGRNYQDDYYD
jgi:phosphatidylserine/phosphatidylglycerophosphate/cardiolipin synthase-like enzyme